MYVCVIHKHYGSKCGIAFRGYYVTHLHGASPSDRSLWIDICYVDGRVPFIAA